MDIVIVFKTGYELNINCEKFETTRNNLTGEIDDYSISGIKDNKPLFLRSKDILCIYRKL